MTKGALIVSAKREIQKMELRQDIIEASKLYKDWFVGKTFMYVFENKYIQVTYRIKDFKHLTGVASNIGAKDFYKHSIEKVLSENNIINSLRYPFNLSRKKVTALLNFKSLIEVDLLILEEITTDSTSYKFGVADLEFTLCLINPTDKNGKVINDDYFVPQSLRVEDSVSRSKNAYEVNFIFVKENNESLYSKLLYNDKKYSISTLSDEIKGKIKKEWTDL